MRQQTITERTWTLQSHKSEPEFHFWRLPTLEGKGRDLFETQFPQLYNGINDIFFKKLF